MDRSPAHFVYFPHFTTLMACFQLVLVISHAILNSAAAPLGCVLELLVIE